MEGHLGNAKEHLSNSGDTLILQEKATSVRKEHVFKKRRNLDKAREVSKP